LPLFLGSSRSWPMFPIRDHRSRPRICSFTCLMSVLPPLFPLGSSFRPLILFRGVGDFKIGRPLSPSPPPPVLCDQAPVLILFTRCATILCYPQRRAVLSFSDCLASPGHFCVFDFLLPSRHRFVFPVAIMHPPSSPPFVLFFLFLFSSLSSYF